MNTISFLLFSVLGTSCIALLQLVDLFNGNDSLSQQLLEWGALDLLWVGLLVFALYQHDRYRQP